MASVPPLDLALLPGDVTLDHVLPARDAELSPALGERGIRHLYSHQAEAYAHVRAGRHLVVVTPTASGKTLCYNLPILQRLVESPGSRALYLFPTKALAQDQLAELRALAAGLPLDLHVGT